MRLQNRNTVAINLFTLQMVKLERMHICMEWQYCDKRINNTVLRQNQGKLEPTICDQNS